MGGSNGGRTCPQVRMVGFEPTLSSTPSWRIPGLSYILSESVQGDLNPRIHHGKVAGCQVTSWTHFGQSQRWDSNPLVPPYESGTRPVGSRRQHPREELNLHCHLRRVAPCPLDHGDIFDFRMQIADCRMQNSEVKFCILHSQFCTPNGIMGSRTPHAVLARHRSDPSVTPRKKSEIRISKSETNPKSKTRNPKLRGMDSNHRHPGSEPGVAAAELPRIGSSGNRTHLVAVHIGFTDQLVSQDASDPKIQTRNPNIEIRNKSEIRSTKSELAAAVLTSPFVLRICFGFRYSDFGFSQEGVRADLNRLISRVTAWPLDHFGIEHHRRSRSSFSDRPQYPGWDLNPRSLG
jgi:hypothetical protein